MAEQNRIEKNLRALARPLGRIAQITLLCVGRKFLPENLMADHARDVDEISGMGLWPTGLFNLLGDAPAPAKFHRARGDLAHFGHGDVAVAALDEHALDAPRAELDGESEPNGSAAAD